MFGNKPVIYTVHIDPRLSLQDSAPIFVREGFSLYAFIFTVFWLAYKRLWGAFALAAVGLTAIVSASHSGYISEASDLVLQLALGAIIGFHAHDFERAELARKGYVTTDIVAATSLLGAQQRFFDRYLPAN
jgi:hypothetical protein